MNSSYETIKSKAETAADRFAAEAPAELVQTVGRIKDEANAQVDRLSSTIRQKPMQSAAIAAGLGFLFAVIARR